MTDMCLLCRSGASAGTTAEQIRRHSLTARWKLGSSIPLRRMSRCSAVKLGPDVVQPIQRRQGTLTLQIFVGFWVGKDFCALSQRTFDGRTRAERHCSRTSLPAYTGFCVVLIAFSLSAISSTTWSHAQQINQELASNQIQLTCLHASFTRHASLCAQVLLGSSAYFQIQPTFRTSRPSFSSNHKMACTSHMTNQTQLSSERRHYRDSNGQVRSPTASQTSLRHQTTAAGCCPGRTCWDRWGPCTADTSHA